MNVIDFQSRQRFGVAPDPSQHLSEPADQSDMLNWWREESARLSEIGYAKPHTAATDYGLVLGLLLGRRLHGVAAMTGLSMDDVRKRWQRLTEPLRNEHGVLPVQAQARMMQVLRSRAGLDPVQTNRGADE